MNRVTTKSDKQELLKKKIIAINLCVLVKVQFSNYYVFIHYGLNCFKGNR